VKIRGCPIEDEIKFSSVKAEAEEENVNSVEGQFILARLREFVKQEKPLTVGVVTPLRRRALYVQLVSCHSLLVCVERELRARI
jgi:hypothetical protein